MVSGGAGGTGRDHGGRCWPLLIFRCRFPTSAPGLIAVFTYYDRLHPADRSPLVLSAGSGTD